MDKGHGLIKYFTHDQKTHAAINQDFEETHARLCSQKDTVSASDFTHLSEIHASAWLNFKLLQAWSWLYHHTPFGEHPSNEARIQTVQDYLDEQASKAAMAP